MASYRKVDEGKLVCLHEEGCSRILTVVGWRSDMQERVRCPQQMTCHTASGAWRIWVNGVRVISVQHAAKRIGGSIRNSANIAFPLYW